MNKIIRLLFFIVVLFINLCITQAQGKFPFSDNSSEESVLAYWYNCPQDSIYWAHRDGTSYLNSHIQVYGRIPADSFSVNVNVFIKERKIIFSKTYIVKEEIENDSLSIKFNESWFRISDIVPYSPLTPTKITVEINSTNSNVSKSIDCKYHKIYGQITDFDGNPKKGFILIKPDGFELDFGFWSDENGFYEITLPERTYNCFYVNDGFYKVNTLEIWCWHMIIDSEQQLDFKIGTGEIYNMNVWANNGGSSTYFISFRPMVLFPGEKNYKKEISGRGFEVIDMCPDLEKSDLTVRINGKETEIYSLQKFFETGKKWAEPSYILQVRKLRPRIGKQTIQLEFLKKYKSDNETIVQSAMGYFEFYLNFSGLSKYR